MRLRWLAAAATAALWNVAVGNALVAADPPPPAPLDPQHAVKMKAGTELFQKEVRQILEGRCVKCHGGEKTEGEFDLNTREALLKGGAEGKAVVPGKSSDSRLVKLITHEIEPNMPEDGAKLPDRQIALIKQWIDLGAPYDKPLVDKNVRPDAWITKTIEPKAREFWSFQPLHLTAPPENRQPLWNANPIDRFVLAQLERQKLSPNPPAEASRLVRRAYFDLLGLPPSPADIDAFVADQDPQALARLVDRLLDNPHFGERWGRHWLDVARFGESHGFEQDYDRPHAYHYRDFVIRAWNDDLPFDQFVRWQIAGDELEPDNSLALMATGFLGAGVFPTQLTEKEFEPARYDELDDMVSTIGTAMLGLTVGCARCHDHKYDPIPSGDYYRLAAALGLAIRSNVALELDSQANRTATAAWEAAHRPLEAELKKFEAEQIPARFDAWLKQRLANGGKPATDAPPAATPTWVIVDPVTARSEGGATLTPQSDGSLLAGGKNPDFDTYTFVVQTQLKGITAVRLEAMADPSLAHGGPGRAPNGNMGLGTFRATAEPVKGGQPPVAVKFKSAKATFEQNQSSLSIAASLDDNPKSGWAVDPQFGKHHAAVFELAEPAGFDGGTKLTFVLEFKVNNKHNIGRPRLAISTQMHPVPLDGDAQRQAAFEILALVDRRQGQLSDDERRIVIDWFKTTDPQWKELARTVADHAAKRPQPKTTQVMIVSEGVKPIPHHADDRGFKHFFPETYYLKRGDTSQKQGVASLGFLQTLMPAGASPDDTSRLSRWVESPPSGAKTSYRRRALANWMTDTEQGAGQLLARVIVNRLWQHHFGRGIVATPNDFGMQGSRPTHPELLDWLAAELIRNGWRLKPIHRLIMTSAAYRQSSAYDEQKAALDPENQWLWRFSPQRLEAEIIRDNMLAVSGRLDEQLFGPGTLDENHRRRSIYFMIKRSRLIPTMQLFDAPEPLVSVGGRPSTTIAPQALLFMNNPQVRESARAFAQRLQPELAKSPAEAVSLAYRLAVGRRPSPGELDNGAAFLQRQTAIYQREKKEPAAHGALTDFCQVLFCLNEFVYVE